MRQSHKYRGNLGICGSFYSQNLKKEEAFMSKSNKFATNQGGVIKAPKPVYDSPKATVVKGNDLRNGKKSK